jgi:hypothetical protein
MMEIENFSPFRIDFPGKEQMLSKANKIQTKTNNFKTLSGEKKRILFLSCNFIIHDWNLS